MAHHINQPGWPRTAQQLRAHGDAARIGTGKLVDGHPMRLGDGGRAQATRLDGTYHGPFGRNYSVRTSRGLTV